MPIRSLPLFRNLPSFLDFLETRGQLARIAEPVSTVHAITEVHRRVIAQDGPALLFERPIKADGAIADMPLVTNLFGTIERVAMGFGIAPDQLGPLGDALAELRSPHRTPTLCAICGAGCRWPAPRCAPARARPVRRRRRRW